MSEEFFTNVLLATGPISFIIGIIVGIVLEKLFGRGKGGGDDDDDSKIWFGYDDDDDSF
jgi:hypothetical protein